jgi:hypothetical protein
VWGFPNQESTYNQNILNPTEIFTTSSKDGSSNPDFGRNRNRYGTYISHIVQVRKILLCEKDTGVAS